MTATHILTDLLRPQHTTYTPSDILGWRETDALNLVPKFQRGPEVWTTPIRSFFIDTMLRGLPSPPIYIRIQQDSDHLKVIHEIIDGQQRIRAVLDYLDGKYALSRSLRASWAGARFDELSTAEQGAIFSYQFVAEVFHGVSDAEVLEIFGRLNTNSVPLNKQELRNGRFFGPFKQTAYALSHEHVEFWRLHRIFTERGFARMLDVELTSELMVVELLGIQHGREPIDRFYRQYDEEFREQGQVENRFRAVFDTINHVFPESLAGSEFRRPPLFYSLFCVAYHRQFGLPGIELPTPSRPVPDKDRRSLNTSVIRLSEILADARAKLPTPSHFDDFIRASTSTTDNYNQRLTRFVALHTEAFND